MTGISILEFIGENWKWLFQLRWMKIMYIVCIHIYLSRLLKRFLPLFYSGDKRSLVYKLMIRNNYLDITFYIYLYIYFYIKIYWLLKIVIILVWKKKSTISNKSFEKFNFIESWKRKSVNFPYNLIIHSYEA